MKKAISIILIFVLVLFTQTAADAEFDLSSMSEEELQTLIKDVTAELNSRKPAEEKHIPIATKPSTDKYTQYIKDYVGRNAASVGYTSWGNDRMDAYGPAYLQLVFVTPDGTYLDFSDESLLKEYLITGQNVEPNTEMKLVYETDSSGKEYDNLISYQSIDTIDLTVRRLDGQTSGESAGYELIRILPSPDKYTWYIRNYVGKNVAAFGYTSWGKDRMDAYGEAYLELSFVTEDGSYIDPEDEESLRQYVVTAQDIKPNSELKITFLKNSHGEEYDNLVDTQTYDTITLYVRRLADG